MHWTTRFTAEAALIAGVVWLVLWGHQAMTHGTTQLNEMRMALGFTWMDSGKLFVMPFLLLIVTMLGLGRSRISGQLGKSAPRPRLREPRRLGASTRRSWPRGSKPRR